MIVPRINQLPILLFLLTSTHANANIQEFSLGTSPASDSPQHLYRREFTQEKSDQWDAYADSNITECISECHRALQAGIDVGTKKYQAQKFECVVKQCNAIEIQISLDLQYSTCMLLSDTIYPEPKAFFNELCLLDDIPEKNIPTEVPFVTKLWPNYIFAKQWPGETATTWVPSASIPLREKAGTANPELTCSNFPEKDVDNGAVKRNAGKGLMEMVVLLAIVTSSVGAFL